MKSKPEASTVDTSSAAGDPASPAPKQNALPQWVLVFGSILLLIVSQIIRNDVPEEFKTIPLVVLPIGLVLFYLGVRAVDRETLSPWLNKPLNWMATKLKVSSGQILLLFFGLCFAVLAAVAAGTQAHMWSPQLAVLSWGTGIILAIAGGFGFPMRRQKAPRTALLIGLALFAGALALRAFNTRYIPIVLSGDEASSGLFSLNFLNGEMDNIFIAGWFSFPSLFGYLQALSIAVFGQTTQALRLLSALAGAITVAVVFFVGRSMYGTTTGLMAGLFLAGMHYHNHFSRIGLNNIWDGLFLVLTLGCLWAGWEKKNRTAFLVAGAALGFSQYFYTSSHSLFLIIPLWLLLAFFRDRKRFKEALPDLFIMCWIAFMVLLPLIWFYIMRPDDFLAPMNRVGIIGDWLAYNASETGQPAFLVLLKQLWTGMLAYTGTPLQAWYLPGVPILRTVPGVIFLLGLVFMAIQPRDSRGQMIFLWLLVFAITGGLSESTPAAQRYVASAPAVALLVAFSVQSIGDVVKRLLPKRGRWIEAVLVVIVLVLAVDDANFYYRDYTPNSDFSGFNGMVAQQLADYLQEEPAGSEVVFCGYPYMGYDSIASLPYLAHQVKFYNVNAPWGSEGQPVPVGSHVYFVFLPDHESDQAAMETEYPGGTWEQFFTTQGGTLFWLYDYTGS